MALFEFRLLKQVFVEFKLLCCGLLQIDASVSKSINLINALLTNRNLTSYLIVQDSFHSLLKFIKFQIVWRNKIFQWIQFNINLTNFLSNTFDLWLDIDFSSTQVIQWIQHSINFINIVLEFLFVFHGFIPDCICLLYLLRDLLYEVVILPNLVVDRVNRVKFFKDFSYYVNMLLNECFDSVNVLQCPHLCWLCIVNKLSLLLVFIEQSF